MSTPHSKDKLIGKILKLFSLGANSSGTTEAEMMAAITQAKVLMARHDISESEVAAAGDRANAAANTSVQYDINAYTAYTRKMKNFARYDEIVAICVSHLTSTLPILTRHATISGNYVSMRFVGTEMDVAVAAKLFMIFLQSVRYRARQEYGSGAWDKRHTSYAIGFASRMQARAQQMAAELTPKEKASTALILHTKETAIAKWMNEQMALTPGKERKSKLNSEAYQRGFNHGGSFNLGRNGLD